MWNAFLPSYLRAQRLGLTGAANRNGGLAARQVPSSHSIRSIIRLIAGSSAAESIGTTCQKHSSRPVAGTRRQPQTRTGRGDNCAAPTRRRTGRLSLQGEALAADGTAGRRRKPWNCASFSEHRSPPFAPSRRSVSVRVNDRLDVIAYPNAATVAAIDLDVLQCHQPGPIHRAGATEGGSAHLLIVRVKI